MHNPNSYIIDVPDPSESVFDGLESSLKLGSEIEAQQAKVAAKRQETQQAEVAAQRQQAMEAELGRISENPTAAAMSKFSVKYPEFGEQMKRSHDMLSIDEQKERVSQGWKFYAAASSETPEIAADLALEQAEAYRNRGMDKEAKELEDLARITKLDPKTAQISAAGYLAATDPENFGETASKLEADRRARGLEGAELTTKQATAEQAAVAAKFAEANVVKDLRKKDWDITKLQEEIKTSRRNTEIAKLRADIEKEKDQTKRADLEARAAEVTRKRDIEIRERTAKLESERGNMDNMLNTIERVLKTPVDVLDNITGPFDSWTPTLFAEEVAAEAQVGLLSSQAFLAQLPQMAGYGSLSVVEKETLERSLQSFSLKQSTEDLLKNVRETKRLVTKMRTNLSVKYGVPDTVPDVPERPRMSEQQRDRRFQQYGVTEQ